MKKAGLILFMAILMIASVGATDYDVAHDRDLSGSDVELNKWGYDQVTLNHGWTLVHGLVHPDWISPASSSDDVSADILAIWGYDARNGEFVLTYPSPDIKLANSAIRNNAFWVYNKGPTKEITYSHLPSDPVEERPLYRGWNLMGITEDMIDVDFRDMQGTCDIDAIYTYHKNAWQRLSLKDDLEPGLEHTGVFIYVDEMYGNGSECYLSLPETKPVLPFIVAVGDDSPSSDIITAINVMTELNNDYELPNTAKLFGEVNATDLHGYVTVAIYNGEVKLIEGADLSAGVNDAVDDALYELNITFETLRSDELPSDNLFDLFIQPKPLLPLLLVVADNAPATDITTLMNVKAELAENFELPPSDIKLFSGIDATRLSDYATVVIYDGEVILIEGANVDQDLSINVDDALMSLRIPYNIMRSENIESTNLWDLFIPPAPVPPVPIDEMEITMFDGWVEGNSCGAKLEYKIRMENVPANKTIGFTVQNEALNINSSLMLIPTYLEDGFRAGGTSHLQFPEAGEYELIMHAYVEDEIVDSATEDIVIEECITTLPVNETPVSQSTIRDILEEGETKTYTINGKDYEVNVLIVTNTDRVKFRVNGELTDALSEGDTYILKDHTQIEIYKISGDLVEFYLRETPVVDTNQTRVEVPEGAILDLLEEGETKTYFIDGKEYEVNALIIADSGDLVKFKINGEVTDTLSEGDTYILKDGIRIGVREILPNEETSGLVEFYLLGATECKITGIRIRGVAGRVYNIMEIDVTGQPNINVSIGESFGVVGLDSWNSLTFTPTYETGDVMTLKASQTINQVGSEYIRRRLDDLALTIDGEVVCVQ